MATEEIAGAVMSATQRGVEILAELIKLLAQATPKLFGGAIDITKFFEERAAAKKAVGDVSRKDLFVAANNAKSAIVSSDNFLKADAEKIAAKAKKYGVPVSVVGGEKQSVSYLERDKDVVNQIMGEIMTERMKEAPQSVKSFSISEGGMTAMKTQFEQNGLDCAFVRSANGNYHCIYPAENAEQVAVLKEDYKKLVNEVNEQFKVEAQFTETEFQVQIKGQIAELTEQYNDEIQSAEFEEDDVTKQAALDKAKEYYEPRIEKLKADYEAEKAKNNVIDGQEITIYDGNDKFSFTADESLTKENIAELMREYFGYSEAKADLAANKLCDDLGLDRSKYFTQPDPTENIELMRTNIRYENDDLTVRDMTFSAVKFKDGENEHIFVTKGENTAALTPAVMSESEMKNICVQHLGMSEEQANMTVKKAVKIDTQINSRVKETMFNRDGTQQTAEIQRTSNTAFTVKVGEKLRSYDFSQINVEDKISKDFGVPTENAKNIVNKAQKQSELQNNIKKATSKLTKKSGEKTQDAVKTKLGKGARK